MAEKFIKLKAGVEVIKNGIEKYIHEKFPQKKIAQREFMELYTCIYHMCTQKPGYEQELYDLYKQIIKEYVKGTVLPSLRDKHDEFLLSELVKRWKNHTVMVEQMSRLFKYLDRYHIPRCHVLRSLKKVGFACFYDAVSQNINMKARDIIISLIEKEREGAQIDRVLLMNCMDYFVRAGLDCYKKHYEEVILETTASYYLGKAMSWVSEEDYSDKYYIEKVKQSLTREKGNVSHYLAFCSKDKLLTTVQQQLLSVYEKHQLDKAKVEDLSRKLSSLLV